MAKVTQVDNIPLKDFLKDKDTIIRTIKSSAKNKRDYRVNIQTSASIKESPFDEIPSKGFEYMYDLSSKLFKLVNNDLMSSSTQTQLANSKNYTKLRVSLNTESGIVSLIYTH